MELVVFLSDFVPRSVEKRMIPPLTCTKPGGTAILVSVSSYVHMVSTSKSNCSAITIRLVPEDKTQQILVVRQ